MYIGDASFIPDETWSLIKSRCLLPEDQPLLQTITTISKDVQLTSELSPLQLLVIDCDHIEAPPIYHTSHLSLASAVNISKRLGATKTYLVIPSDSPGL